MLERNRYSGRHERRPHDERDVLNHKAAEAPRVLGEQDAAYPPHHLDDAADGEPGGEGPGFGSPGQVGLRGEEDAVGGGVEGRGAGVEVVAEEGRLDGAEFGDPGAAGIEARDEGLCGVGHGWHRGRTLARLRDGRDDVETSSGESTR